jgi:hypothetical protein
MHAFVYVQPMECHALLLMPFLLLGMFAKWLQCYMGMIRFIPATMPKVSIISVSVLPYCAIVFTYNYGQV